MLSDSPKPHIDIRYGRFLAPFFTTYAEDINEIQKCIKIQQTSWEKIDSKVLKGLQEITNLTFIEPYIPVYIVPNYEGAFSDPIVISSQQTERFADVLTHELIHRLGDYNQEGVQIREIGKKLYQSISDDTLRDHIFVHAVHTYIYLDILQDPNRLSIDVSTSDGAYTTAWEIVEKEGYKKVINAFAARS